MTWLCLQSWWHSISLWEAIKFWLPTLLSAAAFYLVVKDRRPHLRLKARKGRWFILKNTDAGLSFEGKVEVYNHSNRSNAIREYSFYCEEGDGGWTRLESEHYTHREDGEVSVVYNETPLALAPYSGVEVAVQAFTKLSRRPHKMRIKIQMEDLVGKLYTVEVAVDTTSPPRTKSDPN
jgi:hypothetical protein